MTDGKARAAEPSLFLASRSQAFEGEEGSARGLRRRGSARLRFSKVWRT